MVQTLQYIMNPGKWSNTSCAVLDLEHSDQASNANSECQMKQKENIRWGWHALFEQVEKGKIKQQVLVECVREPAGWTPWGQSKVGV